MLIAAREVFSSCDGLIGVAAPSDYRPVKVEPNKIAKTGEKVTIRRFARYKMGEGLSKREDDFQDEVAKLTGN